VAAAAEDHYEEDDHDSAVAPNKKDVYSDSDPSRVMVRRRRLALQEEKAEQAVLVLVHAQILVVATTGVRVEVVVLLELGETRIDIAEYIDDDAVGDNEVVVHVDDASWDTDFDDVDKEDDDNTVRRISVTML